MKQRDDGNKDNQSRGDNLNVKLNSKNEQWEKCMIICKENYRFEPSTKCGGAIDKPQTVFKTSSNTGTYYW